MSYADVYAYNNPEDFNIYSQFEYALTIGIMVSNGGHCSFTSAKEDLDQLANNMLDVFLKDGVEEFVIATSKSKSQFLILENIYKIHKLSINWVDELTDEPGDDLDQLRELVNYVLDQVKCGEGIFYDALFQAKKYNGAHKNEVLEHKFAEFNAKK